MSAGQASENPRHPRSSAAKKPGCKTSERAAVVLGPMSTTDLLLLKGKLEPASQEELAAAVEDAFASKTPLYPIGGGTSLDFGLPAKAQGTGLSLAKLNRVIDYPARDMTITVEAGTTMRALAELLAKER